MNRSRPRKRFGQHFLHDANIVRKIIAVIQPQNDDHFVEIGPGRGAITQPLANSVGRLDLIEIDRDLAAGLEHQDWATDVHVHCADALRFDFSSLAEPGEKLRLAGNLPYNISSPLLFHLLDFSGLFWDMHAMLQRELVDRMTAQPGSRTYGRLSVALAARCQAERLFHIKPGSFTPVPRVQSSFVRLKPLPQPKVEGSLVAAFDRLVTRAFSMRRKKLSNALRELLDADDMRSLNINPDCRPEELDVDAFVRLSESWHQRGMPDEAEIGKAG